MPLAAVHLHVIILRASHVHVRHPGWSPSISRFAISDTCLGRLVHSRGVSQICVTNRKLLCGHMLAQRNNGVLAQLVERLNGIEEVRGSNPLGSICSLGTRRVFERGQVSEDLKRDPAALGPSIFVDCATRMNCWWLGCTGFSRRNLGIVAFTPEPRAPKPAAERANNKRCRSRRACWLWRN